LGPLGPSKPIGPIPPATAQVLVKDLGAVDFTFLDKSMAVEMLLELGANTPLGKFTGGGHFSFAFLIKHFINKKCIFLQSTLSKNIHNFF
jgi:hypothetical protein